MTRSTLEQLYAAHEGKVSDKWSIYFNEYERIFDNYRDSPIRLLEIGIQNGGSLEIWSKYFPHAQKLVGCDINPDCALLSYEDPRIAVVVGDANSDAAQVKILGYAQAYDVIIDDGSHRSSDVVKSFSRYFPYLADGGVFVAEDLHCSYWQEFEGGLFDPFSSMTFFKRLADVMNQEHWGIEKNRTDILSGFFSKYGFQIDEEALQHVHSVEFLNSMCVIRKAKPERNRLGTRIIAGSAELVVPGFQAWRDRPYQLEPVYDQSRNPWTATTLPDETIQHMELALANAQQQIANLNQAVADRDGQIANLIQAVTEHDSVIRQIMASTSWRLTRPLRAVKSLFSGKASAIDAPPKRFDADWYLKQNPDAAMSGMEPYQHYVSRGKKEGRQFAPDGRLLSRIKRIQLFRILLSSRTQRFLIFLAQNPSKIIPSLAKIHQDWRKEGLPAVERTVTNLPLEVSLTVLWATYKKKFGRKLETNVRDQISRMQVKPLISVLMPTYNTQETFLRQAIDSVRMQLYPNWELCVSDDGSNQPQVRRVLEEYASLDDRIKLRFSETNTNISMATNRALELANGGYVLLLDHDDILEKQALFRVAESIQADDPDFIYSDEALISQDGCDVLGYVFRPSFSLELLRAHPYITHLVAFRTNLLRGMGGLDASLTISQDYDLILRVVEKAATIVHIPEVLYLWRQHQQSAGHEKKERVAATSKQILERHLTRCDESGAVEYGETSNFLEIRYPLTGKSKVAIIIPTKNHGDLVRQCVESIERTVKQVSYEIVVIDHASSDNNSLEYFERLKSMHKVLRYGGAFNFSAINNWAVSQLDDSFTHYLFCNNDIEAIEDGWLERMMELGQKKDVGIVGATLFYPDRHVYQHAGVCVGMYGAAEHYGKFMDKYLPDGMVHPGYLGSLIANHEVSAVTAACLLMREDAFKEIGGFDEKLAVGFGDVDLCLRARQTGFRVMFCPHAALIHHESYTRGKRQTDPHPKDTAFFRQRWQFILNEGDPYFNPNLSSLDTRWNMKKPLEFRLTLNRRIFKQISLPSIK